MTRIASRLAQIVLTATLFISPAFANEADELWNNLRDQVFDDKPIAEDSGVVTLTAPYRAEDAALVPMTITLASDTAAKVRKVTLLIDQNPSPVAATYTFGPAAGTGQRILTSRYRVDSYTNVRAVAELDDGSLHMATKFVKASGGCSAPATKDPETALKGMGKVKIASKRKSNDVAAEAKVMIRHPNFSGMQVDYESGGFTPARFVQEMEVRRGDRLIIRMEGGISISENPHFRFTYDPGNNEVIEVSAEDTEGAKFSGTYHPTGS